MRTLIIIFVGMLLPLAAEAQSVAILPVSYHLYRTDAPSMERALKVSDAVAAGVVQAGMAAVRGPKVTSAAETVAGGADCRDAACAGEVAKAAGADFGIFVSVVDRDGQFDIEIHLSGAAPVAVQPFDTFNAMTLRVTGLVKSALEDAIAGNAEVGPAAGEASVSETVASEGTATEPPARAAAEGDSGPGRKRLQPLAFFVTMGVTAAVGIGYAAVESVGYVKLRKADKSANPEARRKDLKPLQLADRVLMGCTAASAIASIVIFLFTDFHAGPDDETARAPSGLKVIPVATVKGAGLGMSGDF